jgi:hypothetical protein
MQVGKPKRIYRVEPLHNPALPAQLPAPHPDKHVERPVKSGQ